MNEYLTYRRACLLGCERTPCGGLSVGHQRTNEAQYTSINYGRKDQTEWVDGIKRTDGKMEKRVNIEAVKYTIDRRTDRRRDELKRREEEKDLCLQMDRTMEQRSELEKAYVIRQ